MANIMNSVVQLNVKATVAALVGGAVMMYLAYSWYAGSAQLQEALQETANKEVKVFNSWKTKEFVEIPDTVKDQMKKIKIEERKETFKFDEKNFEIFYREASDSSKSKKPDVLLLHGMAFSSQNWQDIETLQLLAVLGHKAVAIDLPGWGNSKGDKLAEDKKAQFIQKFIDQKSLGKPIVVSPSMSGSFAIPYIMGGKAFTCQERASGFIALAPVGTTQFTDSQYHKCEIPTMIVYGSKDTKLGLHSLNDLRNMPNKEIFVQEKAGHPCYIEKPEEWRYYLYNYILAVERKKEYN